MNLKDQPNETTLSEIRAMLDKTTPGSWLNDYAGNLVTDSNPSHGYTFNKVICNVRDNWNDATWIVASKDVCEYLLKLVEAYREVAIHEAKNGDRVPEWNVDTEAKKRMEAERGS